MSSERSANFYVCKKGKKFLSFKFVRKGNKIEPLAFYDKMSKNIIMLSFNDFGINDNGEIEKINITSEKVDNVIYNSVFTLNKEERKKCKIVPVTLNICQ